MATLLRNFAALRISARNLAQSTVRTAGRPLGSTASLLRQYTTAATRLASAHKHTQCSHVTQCTTHSTVGSLRYVSGHLGYKNKSHSGTSKRIKLTGNGLLKRYPAGKQHCAQSKNTKRVRRLRTETVVRSSQHMQVMRGIPAGRTRIMQRKRMKYIAKKHGQRLTYTEWQAQLPARPLVRDKLLDLMPQQSAQHA